LCMRLLFHLQTCSIVKLDLFGAILILVLAVVQRARLLDAVLVERVVFCACLPISMLWPSRVFALLWRYVYCL
jgi:hypothetical protein